MAAPNPTPAPGAPGDWRAKVTVPPQALCIFSRQLATMLRNAVPIVQALETLSHQEEYPNFGEVIREIAEKVSQGHVVSYQMSFYPRVFFKIYVTLVQIGERTGDLDSSLERLSDWLERDNRLRERIKSALSYPVFVLILATCLTLFMFYTVLPSFLTIFRDMNVPLPLITRTVMFITEAVRQPGFWLLFIGATGVFVSVWREVMKTSQGQVTVWRAVRRIPLLGGMLLKGGCARYCMSVEAMLRSGMDVSRTLRMAAGASGNPEFVLDAPNMEKTITEGEPVSDHMAMNPDIYPSSLTHMVMAGEQASRLPEMFGRAGGYYDIEMNYTIDALSAAMEPLLLASVASMVAVVILSIFLPLYSFLGSIG
ncbi:type II secretion system F family protein [bacterium]|nr:type II secretion system F family protein [bacterium]